MAQLLFENNPLILNGTSVEFQPEGIPISVGFYQINGSNISTDPALFLCSNVKYAVRVGIPDNPSENLFIGPGSEGRFTLKTPKSLGGLPSSIGLLPFQILQTESVLLNRSFLGQLGLTSGYYKLTSTPSFEWESVGYSHGLPVLLNSCQLCGCGPGKVCGTIGVCKEGPFDICPEYVPCGYRSGKCPGGCPTNGYSCENVNGYYVCTMDNTAGFNFWIFIGLAIAFLILGLILAIFTRSTYLSMEPKTTEKRTTVAIGPVQGQETLSS